MSPPVCKNCGKGWGAHYGDDCDTPAQPGRVWEEAIMRRWVGLYRCSPQPVASWTQDARPGPEGITLFGYGPEDAFDIVANEQDLIRAMEVIVKAAMAGKPDFGTVEWAEYLKWADARGVLGLVGQWMSPSSLPGPRKPKPQVPPEVWNEQPVDPDAAMEAVRNQCKGV